MYLSYFLMIGKRFDLNDKKIKELTTILHEALTISEGPMVILDLYPQLSPFIPQFIKNSWMKEKHFRKQINSLHTFLKVRILNAKSL